MPLDVARLRDSDLALSASGDEFKAAVLLWCASWCQVPAASLPADDRLICRLAGLDLKAWARVKAGALRGWVECDDGRLYHPTVAEKARDAWERRQDWEKANAGKAARQQRWRERCKALSAQLRASGVEVPAGASLATLEALVDGLHVDASVDVYRDAGETGKTGTGTGTVYSAPTERAPQPPDPDREAWQRGTALLCRQGRMKDAQARKLFGAILRDHKLQARDLLPSVVKSEASGTEDPQSYLKAAARALASRTAANVPAPSRWGDDQWNTAVRLYREDGSWSDGMGPRPDQPGCEAPHPILVRHGYAAEIVSLPVRRAKA